MAEDQFQKFMMEIAKIHLEIEKSHQRMTDHYAEEERFKQQIKEKLDPMFEVFTSVKGFNNTTVSILKFLIVVGGAWAVIYGFFRWLKS